MAGLADRIRIALDHLSLDLRHTVRTLSRDRAFTGFAVLIAGLGIGASATIFAVVNAVLIRPLPFRAPSQLVWMTNHDSSGLSGQTTQVGYLLDLRQRAQSYSALGGYMAFYGVGDYLMSGSGEAERFSGVQVTDNFFQTLGVAPQIGRFFTPEECRWNAPRAVLITHGMWTRRFAGDPGVVGRSLVLNGEPATVIGVLPESFDFGSVFAPGRHFDLFLPFPLTQETNRWGNTLAIVGRLRRGVSTAQAQSELTVLAKQLVAANPNRNDFEGRLAGLADRVGGRYRLPLLVLAAAVGVLMLIVCANLSNLLLARAEARRKEIAVRAALGAGRGRLLAQTLTEGAVLSGCGAVLGLLLAAVGTRLVAGLDVVGIPLLAAARVDWTVAAFTLLAAVATGLVFGIAPALQAPISALHDSLKDATRGSTGGSGRSWARGALVVAEITFACVLFTAAALLARSFARVLDVNLGFQPERAYTIRVDPEANSLSNDQLNTYFDDVLRRVRDVPGISAAGMTDALPLGRNRTWGAGVKGQTYPKGKYPTAFPRMVTDGYLAAMGVPLREGRFIAATDTASSEPVIVVNETLARTLFPPGRAVGGVIRQCGAERRVVGVVGDVRHLALEQGAGMEMYLPMRQCHDVPSLDLVVRSTMPAGQVASAIRAALKPIAPNLPGAEFRTIEALVDKSVSPRRFLLWLIAGFAGFALILASLGIYSVVAYSVRQRAAEIGIRMALGASPGAIQKTVVGRTLGLAAIAILLGGVTSRLLAGALRGLLFGVTPGDPATFAAVAAILAAVAALAGLLPARRAARIDPSLTLRAN